MNAIPENTIFVQVLPGGFQSTEALLRTKLEDLREPACRNVWLSMKLKHFSMSFHHAEFLLSSGIGNAFEVQNGGQCWLSIIVESASLRKGKGSMKDEMWENCKNATCHKAVQNWVTHFSFQVFKGSGLRSEN